MKKEKRKIIHICRFFKKEKRKKKHNQLNVKIRWFQAPFCLWLLKKIKCKEKHIVIIYHNNDTATMSTRLLIFHCFHVWDLIIMSRKYWYITQYTATRLLYISTIHTHTHMHTHSFIFHPSHSNNWRTAFFQLLMNNAINFH